MLMKNRIDNRRAGFSLTELTVSVSIIAIITASLLISQVRRMPTLRLNRAVNQVSTDLRLARMQAASANTDVEVTFNNAQESYSIWVDRNRNGTKDTGEIDTKSLRDLPDQNLWAHPTTGTFHPNGTFTSSASYSYIGISAPEAGYKYVYVLPSGQIDPHNL
jgi:type IV fimbrial biogenesis protein FimT